MKHVLWAKGYQSIRVGVGVYYLINQSCYGLVTRKKIIRPSMLKSTTECYEQGRKNDKTILIYEVDPLICPKCQGEMRIVAFIEDKAVIKKILKHLSLCETRNHDPPARNPTHIPKLTYDDDYSQLPAVDYWLQYRQFQNAPF